MNTIALFAYVICAAVCLPAATEAVTWTFRKPPATSTFTKRGWFIGLVGVGLSIGGLLKYFGL